MGVGCLAPAVGSGGGRPVVGEPLGNAVDAATGAVLAAAARVLQFAGELLLAAAAMVAGGVLAAAAAALSLSGEQRYAPAGTAPACSMGLRRRGEVQMQTGEEGRTIHIVEDATRDEDLRLP